MSTISNVISRLNPIWKNRYRGEFVDWVNDLLSELAAEGVDVALHYEAGFVVSDKKWIDKPTGMRKLNRLWNPQNSGQLYNFEEVNGRIKIVDAEIDEEDSPDTASSFSNYSTTGITVDISDATEDGYKDYLFVITAGTLADNTYVIGGNADSAGGTCALTFLHPLTTALNATNVTAASLIHPDYYVMGRYEGSYDVVAGAGTELPLTNELERPLVQSYLEYRSQQRVSDNINDTRMAYEQYMRQLRLAKNSRRRFNGSVAARYLPGLTQYRGHTLEEQVSYSEDLQ